LAWSCSGAAITARSSLLITSDLAYAGAILAEKTGINWASQVLSPLSFLSAYDDSVLPPLPWLWRLKALGPRAYGTILSLARHAARRLSEPINAFRRSLGLAPKCDPFFDHKHSPSLVLAMFSRLLGEPRPDWPSQAVVTGFTFYDGDHTISQTTRCARRGSAYPKRYTSSSALPFLSAASVGVVRPICVSDTYHETAIIPEGLAEGREARSEGRERRARSEGREAKPREARVAPASRS
jgi:hypothetical protein